MQKARHIGREEARDLLTRKAEGLRKSLADPHSFSTYPLDSLLEDTEFRLRWIDCAPEGANHQCAPMQDKTGTPMGGVYNENVGPGEGLRNARAKRGLHPISGERMAA